MRALGGAFLLQRVVSEFAEGGELQLLEFTQQLPVSAAGGGANV